MNPKYYDPNSKHVIEKIKVFIGSNTFSVLIFGYGIISSVKTKPLEKGLKLLCGEIELVEY